MHGDGTGTQGTQAPPGDGAAHRTPHPHMIRVVLGGEGLAEFGAGEFTDHYVKLLFRRPGVEYPEPFDVERIRAELPREQWPVTRTYTVRAWDPASAELTIDFVHHGDKGVAGPWAAAARPGEDLFFNGPGGAYAPSPEADWHLFAGDESALPPSPPPSNASRSTPPSAPSSRSPPGGGAGAAHARCRGDRLAAPGRRPGRRPAGRGGPEAGLPGRRGARLRARRGELRQDAAPPPACRAGPAHGPPLDLRVLAPRPR